MKVTHVPICPTPSVTQPPLHPELLAAVAARYSRTNEGLDAILAKVAMFAPEKAVDAIFKHVEYGHASIADMAPVSIFMDGVSIWLIYYLFYLSPVGSGQECSTRYIKLKPELLGDPSLFGIAETDRAEWEGWMGVAVTAYEEACVIWEGISRQHPELLRLPAEKLAAAEAGDEKAANFVQRIRNNFVFDRARYFIPLAFRNNMMIVQSALQWSRVVQHLYAHPSPEAQVLAGHIAGQLALAAPNMARHAVPKDDVTLRTRAEFEDLRHYAKEGHYESPSGLTHYTPSVHGEEAPYAHFKASTMAGYSTALKGRTNRYSPCGTAAKLTSVSFGWNAVAFAESRDLNRHRTGAKSDWTLPVGFYCALDQVPSSMPAIHTRLSELSDKIGVAVTRLARMKLVAGDACYPYWMLLGTQHPFFHTTTLHQFVYEAELRTGLGANFRYAKHLRDLLKIVYAGYPALRGLIMEGGAEPE